MRKTARSVVVVLALVATAWLVASQFHSRQRRLPDGSVICLEKIVYGQPAPFEFGGILEQLEHRLPSRWAAFFSTSGAVGRNTWYLNMKTHPTNDALLVYVTRRDRDTKDYLDLRLTEAQLVDEHGCVFIPTQIGGEDDGHSTKSPKGGGNMGAGYAVTWFRFEAFPRHESKFRLRLFDPSSPENAEFVVINPAPVTSAPTNWLIEPLPITKSFGDVSFTLAGVKLTTPAGQSASQMVPTYEIREHGQLSTNWQCLDEELFDASGNFASEMDRHQRFLCSRESAWKLRVTFFGSEQSSAASNTTWTLRDLKVPGPGMFTPLSVSRTLRGVDFRAYGLGGEGEFVYRNHLPVEAAPLNGPLPDSSVGTTGPHGSETYTVHARTPHLLLEIGELSANQRLTVHATDDRGRNFYAHSWNHWTASHSQHLAENEVHYLEEYPGEHHDYGVSFLAFDLPADSKTVDVTICVHEGLTSEFIFKPPSENVSTREKSP